MLGQVQQCLYLGPLLLSRTSASRQLCAARPVAHSSITATLESTGLPLAAQSVLAVACRSQSHFSCLSIGLKTVGMMMQLDADPENALRGRYMADAWQMHGSQVLHTAGRKIQKIKNRDACRTCVALMVSPIKMLTRGFGQAEDAQKGVVCFVLLLLCFCA